MKNKVLLKLSVFFLFLFVILAGLVLIKNEKDSKGDVPYSLEKVLYGYTSDVDADPEYEVKVVIYPHPDRINSDSYVEYYSNGVLVKSEKIR